MLEADIINNEIKKMDDLDQSITMALPNLDSNDPTSVSKLQSLLNLRFSDTYKDDALLVDGQWGNATNEVFRTWLSNVVNTGDIVRGARNTVVNQETALQEGTAKGYKPFVDVMIANRVLDVARENQGMDKVINSVVQELSIDNLGGDNENA
jgi:hypothetical protein